MELLLKITALCVLVSILAVFFRPSAPLFGLLTVLAAAGCCLFLLLNVTEPILRFFDSILQQSSLEQQIFSPLLKVLVISVVGRVGSSFCKDSGSALGGALIELAGSFCAILTALPVLQAVMQLFLQWI